jgi:hypothetical protein
MLILNKAEEQSTVISLLSEETALNSNFNMAFNY